ncbi:hypothetical protein E4U43_000613 [Claviceps pusilla]|uniref:DUF3074 domain-containing protein n=1 Tax=Claviceps pusilla TaxID=123648 RepID=A0A9P7T009_9HYPO|nr:hypothetical protein E4U43_000613 [Claviceps pusilla]
MGSHHEPLKALAPIDWNDVLRHDLPSFLNDCFDQAQIVIDSVPSAASTATTPAVIAGRARAKTDSAVVYKHVPAASTSPSPSPSPFPDTPARQELSARLRKEWKEVKTSPRDNPLGISVYKLAGKDGKGTWFARRSVHAGLSFEQWKTGLQREFGESVKVQGAPGSGNIRGVGAERNVEHRQVEDAGHLDVFQLSAQFPGPTAPRDFITLLLTSDFSHRINKTEKQRSTLRQYMIVSKPCVHPECPPRRGIIRGQYESVEIIREIPVDAAGSADADDAGALNKKRSLSSADLVSGENRNKSVAIDRTGDDIEGGAARAIEWIMITRSDPGGSVPRFLIDKGTPPGIIGDAGKFLDWVSRVTEQDGNGSVQTSQVDGKDGTTGEGGHRTGEINNSKHSSATTTTEAETKTTAAKASHITLARDSQPPTQNGSVGYSDSTPSSTGLYGVITGAFGVAGEVLRSQFGIPLSFASSQDSLSDGQVAPEEEEEEEEEEEDDDDDDDDDDEDRDADTGYGAGDDSKSDASSMLSFASALEKSVTGEDAPVGSPSTRSDESKSQRPPPPDKDLQKLFERREKLNRSYARFQARMQTKRQGAQEKDATALAKLREKLDKEAAKKEAKYHRAMRKLEQKRAQEERKAEARRRKAAERQEKSGLTLELEKARVERDVVVREVELLQLQVGELQRQNTMLVARLGRMGIGMEGGSGKDSMSSSSRENLRLA